MKHSHKNQNENKNAVAILRVSSHRQKDNFSHQTQESEIRQYCQSNDLNLIRVIAIVESAKDSEKRFKFQSAVEDAIKDKIRHIMFFMADRETRNLTDLEKAEQLIKKDRIVLHYVKDNKQFSKHSSDSDFFLRDVLGVTNKQFIRTLSAKVQSAMLQKAQDGWSPSNHVPLGYAQQKRKDEDGRELKRGTIIVPDPNEKNVTWVKREFELRSLGYSLEQIRDICIEEGLVPIKLIKSYRPSTVEKRIKNPFYDGYFLWQGDLHKGKHELIIPLQHRERVKAMLGRRYDRRDHGEHSVLVGGFLRCGINECQCNIILDPKTKKYKDGHSKTYNYLHCADSRRVHKKNKIRQSNVTAENVWEQLSLAVDSISLTQDLASEIAQAMNDVQRRSRDTTKRNFEQFRAQLKDAEKREADLILLFQRGIIDGDALSRQHRVVKEEIQKLTYQLEGLQNELNDAVVETANSLLELCISAKSLWESRSPSERREFLDMICSNPRLNGASVEFDLKKPFVTVAEMLKKENWRSQRDSNSCILREREVS